MAKRGQPGPPAREARQDCKVNADSQVKLAVLVIRGKMGLEAIRGLKASLVKRGQKAPLVKRGQKEPWGRLAREASRGWRESLVRGD